MLSAIVDEDRDSRVIEDPVVPFIEIPCVLQHVSRQIDDLENRYGGVERGRVQRVADTEADHEHTLRLVGRQKWNVGKRAHVSLRRVIGARHRESVRIKTSEPGR